MARPRGAVRKRPRSVTPVLRRRPGFEGDTGEHAHPPPGAAFTSGRTHHELFLIEVGPDAAPIPEGRRVGMYHFGLKVGESDDELREAQQRLAEEGVPVVGAPPTTRSPTACTSWIPMATRSSCTSTYSLRSGRRTRPPSSRRSSRCSSSRLTRRALLGGEERPYLIGTGRRLGAGGRGKQNPQSHPRAVVHRRAGGGACSQTPPRWRDAFKRSVLRSWSVA